MQTLIPVAAEPIITALVAGITKINNNLISGIYLTGSIPLKDFHANKSDIDFVILCSETPEIQHRQQIAQLHITLKNKFKHPRLNGFYISVEHLDIHNPRKIKALYFEEGRIKESGFEMLHVTLYELKTSVITLYGIPASDLSIPIERKDIDEFLLNNINSYWKNWVNKHSVLGKHKLLLILFPRLTEWVILGLARQLYTIKTGRIISKSGAGYYCLETLPSRYHHILHEAIRIRNESSKHFLSIKTSYYLQPSFNRAAETLACARYLIHIFNEAYRYTHR